jgi:hypothetical protein
MKRISLSVSCFGITILVWLLGVSFADDHEIAMTNEQAVEFFTAKGAYFQDTGSYSPSQTNSNFNCSGRWIIFADRCSVNDDDLLNLKFLPDINGVRMGGWRKGTRGLQITREEMKNFAVARKITSFSFEGNQNFMSPKAKPVLRPDFSGLPHLACLSINRVCWDSDFETSVGEQIGRMKNLRQLDIFSVTDDFFTAFPETSKIESLRVGSASQKFTGHNFVRMKNLRSLHLHLFYKATPDLISNLKKLDQLDVLCISLDSFGALFDKKNLEEAMKGSLPNTEFRTSTRLP